MFIDTSLLIFIAICAVVGAMASAGAAYVLNLIVANFAGLSKRVGDLEAVVAKRRHTYATAEGIEDATAVVIDMETAIRMAREARQKAEDAEDVLTYLEARAVTARGILGETHQGPLAYKARPAVRPPRPDGHK